MQSITFPKTSFRTAIRGYTRQDGRGLDSCLWRELIQNARDAGATRVDASLAVSEETITLVFRDNGKGMDWETLERGMLTYSGSVKEAGNAGGFGMAKNVLCFASESTTIRTLDVGVRIEGIMYERLDCCEPLQGTELTIVCDRKEQPDLRLEPTAEGLRFLLARCDLRGMTVYLDGLRVPDCRHDMNEQEVVHTFAESEAKAYYWKRRKPFIGFHGQPVAVLCHKGIWICDISAPSGVKGAILINTEADAKKVLNDTRTQLSSYWQRLELETWLGRLNAGAHSTLKTKKFVRRFDGGLFCAHASRLAERVAVEESAPADDSQADPIRLTLAGRDAVQFLAAVAARLDEIPAEVSRLDGRTLTPAEVSERLEAVETANVQETAQAIRQLLWRPALMVVNEKENAVPKGYLPESMTPRVRQILTVWSELVRQFLVWRKDSRLFGVGFIFSDDTAAQFRQESDGTIWLLLNPIDAEGYLDFKMSSEEDRNRMILSAAHEVAHAVCGDDTIHGDGFVVALEQNLRLAMNNSKVLNRIWKTCR